MATQCCQKIPQFAILARVQPTLSTESPYHAQLPRQASVKSTEMALRHLQRLKTRTRQGLPPAILLISLTVSGFSPSRYFSNIGRTSLQLYCHVTRVSLASMSLMHVSGTCSFEELCFALVADRLLKQNFCVSARTSRPQLLVQSLKMLFND